MHLSGLCRIKDFKSVECINSEIVDPLGIEYN